MFTSFSRPTWIHRRSLLVLSVALSVVLVAVAQSTVRERLISLYLGEVTVYTERYSESRFRSISPGMSMTDVLSVMGPPLRRAPWGGYPQVWFYSDQKTITDNFWRRWVIVDTRKDRVATIVDDFWIE
jgi:outer membrane protein assembly factor BamE (lipoprotein component of BamABCDE complex)